MKERPILFTGEMVRAILDGRKTQTRRVVKDVVEGPGGWPSFTKGRHHGNMVKPKYCTYGQHGDLLYVREAFIHQPAEYLPEASCSIPFVEEHTVYRADVPGDSAGAGWSPSIHMPKRLCRLWLRVKSVRVERVQDISIDDAFAEGVRCINDRERIEFRKLWDSINAKRGFGWDVNPWTWVIEFDRTTPTGGR